MKRQDNGSVATNSKDLGILNLAGSDIYGTVATGPGGNPAISSGAVGDKAWVDGNRVGTNGSLKLYVGGDADLGGNGIVNESGKTGNFMLFGLPGCTDIKFHGNGTFYGAIYAPNADLKLAGGGNGSDDFSGASVTRSVTFNGHFKFHFDESLARLGMGKGYVLTSWNEMTPQQVANKPIFD